MIKSIACIFALFTLSVFAAPASATPDIALCQITAPTQFGRVGEIGSGTIGVVFGTSHYNAGTIAMPWGSLPDNTHPLFTQNMYRLRVVDGSTRLEQIGQSWVFNSYCPLQIATCAPCAPAEACGPTLGPGCATPHSAGNMAAQSNLSARGHVNPFTGVYPPTLNNHAGHSHNGISHRLQVEDADLIVPDATYLLESHAVSPHDASTGNPFNNVGHREVLVSGPSVNGDFSFALQGETNQHIPAIYAWSTAVPIEVDPSPGTDGRLIVAYEVTQIADDLYHYEYAIYNMNNDAGVGAFAVAVAPCVGVDSVGFHAVRNHAPEANAPSYSNTPWETQHADGVLRWSTESLQVNPNANAIRWGTMYNFRFDSAGPPVQATAEIGMFKTGRQVLIVVPGPGTPSALRADFNNDCHVDESDALELVNALLGLDADPAAMDRADLNMNGTVDAEDISHFLAAALSE